MSNLDDNVNKINSWLSKFHEQSLTVIPPILYLELSNCQLFNNFIEVLRDRCISVENINFNEILGEDFTACNTNEGGTQDKIDDLYKINPIYFASSAGGCRC